MHLHIEIKINDVWEHYGCPYIPRDYEMFGKMAGVRNKEIIPIVQPKGLPEDITLLTKIGHEQEKYHHESWFNISEIAEFEKWFNERAKRTKETFRWYPGASWFLYLEEMTGYLFCNGFTENTRLGIQDVRFVFWFDN